MLRLEMHSSVELDGYGMQHSSNILVDPKTKYKTNALGFRTSEFNSATPNFVFAGCSHTWGWGVDESLIWGNKIAQLKKIESKNLAISNAAITTIIDNLMAYFDKFGKPKILFCLFPSLARMNIWTNRDVLVGRHGFDAVRDTAVPKININSLQKYSQRPHKLENIATEEFPTLISLKYILNFEQYCKSNNIVLRYAFWDPDDEQTMSTLSDSNSYTSYVKSDSQLWTRDGIDEIFNNGETCHLPTTDLEKYHWKHGTDIELSSLPHISAHRHIHYYELFVKEYDRIIQ